MWDAWIYCWEANLARDDRVAFIENYQRALQIYVRVGKTCRQDRIKLNALSAARLIRRKLNAIETGALTPNETTIPGEITMISKMNPGVSISPARDQE